MFSIELDGLENDIKLVSHCFNALHCSTGSLCSWDYNTAAVDNSCAAIISLIFFAWFDLPLALFGKNGIALTNSRGNLDFIRNLHRGASSYEGQTTNKFRLKWGSTRFVLKSYLRGEGV